MIKFRRRTPWDEPREDKRTDKQKAAHERNWKIVRLRGLWFSGWLLTGPRRDALQALVDEELALLGAQSQTERQREQQARWLAEAEKEAAA